MSWLKRVMGKKSVDEWLAEADAQEKAGDLGAAKLAFDRAAGEANEDASRERAEAGAARCCDGLARTRLQDAIALHARGQHELAHEELLQALDTARSEEVRAEVRKAIHDADRQEIVESLAGEAQLSAEERFTLISSNWEPHQAEELEPLGDALADALVQLESGAPEEALHTLHALLEEASDARYLWLEVGRARIASGQLEDGREALRTFLARIGPEEGGNARLTAHGVLAQLAHDAGDVDAAIEELEACAAALEDDPRPLLQLGSYLRHAERPTEALEVLQLCQGLFTDGPVEWPVLLEIGLSQADAGRHEAAIGTLESVVEAFSTRGERALPPVLATRLATLHEQGGNLARAADLYAGLSRSGEAEERRGYMTEAARLLEALGLGDEAERMRERMQALD